MDLLNLSDWLFKHFNIRIPATHNNIFFQFESSITPHIYVFDTYQPWEYFYAKIVYKLNQNCKELNHKLILSLQQLVKNKGLWEKLYYLLGKNFFLFLFLKCSIYFKWGRNTYILLSSKPNKPLNYIYNQSLPSIYNIGFDKDVNINIHKILYSTNCQNSLKCLVPKKKLCFLKSDILNQYVGPEISKVHALGTKQIISLKKMIKLKPNLEQCKLILDEIVHLEDIIVPVEKVVLFLTKVIDKFVPYKLLFQRNFLKRFLRNMQQFLKFSLKQKVTLGFVMNGIAENQDPLKRNAIAKILMWLINKFIIKIIRSFFYVSVTDKSNSLIFMKQQFWLNCQKMILHNMIIEGRLVEVKDPICTQNLKKIKFIPKLSGKFDELSKDKLELCNIFLKQLIASKRKGFPNPSKELHSVWLNHTKKKIKAMKYYYAKTDIKDAYGSMIHDKLKNILQKWFNGIENNLTVMSFDFKGKWGKLETIQQFINFPSSAGDKVLIYKVGNDKNVSLCELKSLIFYYIDNIYVSFSTKNYKVIKGLSQGGQLSAALCEIYYSSFDYDYLSEMCDFNEGEILLRAVDDYIFISHKPEKIYGFLNMMSTGIPEYGVGIQNEKTITNIPELFETEFYFNSIVPFFGYYLDVNKGFITPDFSNYEGINIQSIMTFNKLNKRILLQKMSSTLSLKLHPLLFDHEYQSIRTIVYNIHCASCVMALKYIAIISFLKFAKIKLEEKYLIFCITKGTHSIASYVSKKDKKSIDYCAVKKICLKSFILVLERRKYFLKIIRMLKLKVSRLKVKSRRTEHIIKAVGKILPQSLSYSLQS